MHQIPLISNPVTLFLLLLLIICVLKKNGILITKFTPILPRLMKPQLGKGVQTKPNHLQIAKPIQKKLKIAKPKNLENHIFLRFSPIFESCYKKTELD